MGSRSLSTSPQHIHKLKRKIPLFGQGWIAHLGLMVDTSIMPEGMSAQLVSQGVSQSDTEQRDRRNQNR
jgi:hypothetical protein